MSVREPAGRSGPWMALRPGQDEVELAAQMGRAHRQFVAGGHGVDYSDDVRPVIRQSWERSQLSGVNPESGGRLASDNSDLAEYRVAHPMSTVLPVVRKLLVEDAEDSSLLVAISDASGRLLWVEGDTQMRDHAGTIAFVEGADWSEAAVGTNAPGTALAVDHCVQIFGAEHFSRQVHRWSCAAAPVHHPVTGAILGSIDITGGSRVAAPEVLTLVRATVAAAELELRWRMQDGGLESPAQVPLLSVLGRARPTLTRNGAEIQLSPRHAEILLLLAEHSEGMGAEQLAVLLDERFLDSVTVRAELSRLRRVLGPGSVGSRPYRLQAPLRTDLDVVRESLARGDVVGALQGHPGPVLADSLAPGVVEIRERLDAEMRGAVLRSRDARLLQAWAGTVSGRDDPIIWQALAALMPTGSPAHVQARAHLDLLNRRFGISATSLQRSRS
ncbi:transcriptional regulator [Tomitella biformata]|uniref:transcriptional regulator n=1 Tax=Tomitella biformata TaxID=630403 RepID=UPI00046574EC|nr:transcriptional regulator [Tomitella biformata]